MQTHTQTHNAHTYSLSWQTNQHPTVYDQRRQFQACSYASAHSELCTCTYCTVAAEHRLVFPSSTDMYGCSEGFPSALIIFYSYFVNKHKYSGWVYRCGLHCLFVWYILQTPAKVILDQRCLIVSNTCTIKSWLFPIHASKCCMLLCAHSLPHCVSLLYYLFYPPSFHFHCEMHTPMSMKGEHLYIFIKHS